MLIADLTVTHTNQLEFDLTYLLCWSSIIVTHKSITTMLTHLKLMQASEISCIISVLLL